MTERLLSVWGESIGGALSERPARAPAAFIRTFVSEQAAMRARARERSTTGQPGLSARLRRGHSFVFAQDGYPVSAGSEGMLVSPASGATVMRDYLDRFSVSFDPDLLLAAERVGTAALGRMQACGDGLAFFYDERTSPTVARNPDRHYSALTQSRYLVAFWKLADAVHDGPFGRSRRAAREQQWREATSAVLRSLLVPVEAGGVLYAREPGPVLAATPAQPHHVTLNGWLAAAQNIGTYARATGDEEAAELFEKTMRALEAFLPTFDAPAFRTSRPGSTGFGLFALELPESREGHWISDMTLRVPGETTYRVAGSRDRRYGRWRSCMLSPAPRGSSWVVPSAARVNLVLNRLSYPEPNVLRVHIDAAAAGTLSLKLAAREYDPLKLAADGPLVEIARANLRQGPNEVALAIPWKPCELVVYPATLTSRDASSVDSVHAAHVDRLARLAKISGSEVLAGWSTRWGSYSRAPDEPSGEPDAVSVGGP